VAPTLIPGTTRNAGHSSFSLFWPFYVLPKSRASKWNCASSRRTECEHNEHLHRAGAAQRLPRSSRFWSHRMVFHATYNAGLPVFSNSESCGPFFVVIALTAGFPIAMLLSWVYEFTAEGIVRTEGLRPAHALITSPFKRGSSEITNNKENRVKG
jgi:hypothetical protein